MTLRSEALTWLCPTCLQWDRETKQSGASWPDDPTCDNCVYQRRVHEDQEVLRMWLGNPVNLENEPLLAAIARLVFARSFEKPHVQSVTGLVQQS